MIRHDGWSHMIVTLMTCVSTLSNALILLAIEIAILSGASTRWWQSSRRWTPTQMPKTKKDFSVRRGYTMSCQLWIAWDVYPLWCTLLDCVVVAFYYGDLSLKNIKVVSVHPTVAPSEIRIFLGCAMSTWVRTNPEEWGGWGQTSQQDH